MSKWVGRATVAGLIGAGVSVLCLVPPIIHFVTGPLGPFIGGIVGGARGRVTGAQAWLVGLIMGGVLAIVVTGGTLLLRDLWFPQISWQASWIVALVVFLYAASLGALGAIVGGRMAS